MTFTEAMERLLPDKPVRRYLVLLALLFAAAFPAGMFNTNPSLAGLAKTFVELMDAPVDEMAGGVFFLLVLLNNLFASLLLLLSGVLFGIFPVLSVGVNGFLMGMVYTRISETAGPGRAALDMIPHALFDIPALLIVAAYGLWIGVGVIRRILGKEDRSVHQLARHAMVRYFALVLPLLIAGAAAETFLVLRGK